MTARKPRKTAPKAPRAALSQAIASSGPVIAVAPEPPAALKDSELALLALYAEDAFCSANGGPVMADPRLAPKWSVVGVLTAVDAPLRFGRHKVGAKRVFYGWLLADKYGRRVLAIRGTEGCIEWLIDGLFAPRSAHPIAGKVESGFWDVFSSMKVDGKPLSSLAPGDITIVGHSLGAALATYASLELARAGAKVRGVFVASPHPGDAPFCKAFGVAVPDHVMYRNVRDIVPLAPLWFGYSHVPNVQTLSAQSGLTITGGWSAQHHVISYVALLDRVALRIFKPLPCDLKFLECLRGSDL